MNISVTYDGSGLIPVPTVSVEHKFIDFASYRHGEVLEISLQGFLTGISSTGSVSQITNIFAQQFASLTVSQVDPSSGIYSWDNVVVDEISFPQDHYYEGAFIPYTVKCHSYSVPSGINDPTNKYSYVLNSDSTANVTHEISARGVRGVSGALNNAISFVRSFTGKQPFAECSSFFIPSGYGVLQSLNEKVDRLNGTYSVTENYKYNTGSNNPFISLSNIEVSNILEENYLTVDYNATFKGSPVYNNLTALNSGVSGFNILNDISSNYGIDTNLLIATTSNIDRNSGEANYTVKMSFLSGYSNQDLTGFLDYEISLEKDVLLPKESWKIDGEFVCRGPLLYRKQQLNTFKGIYGSDWRSYLISLISGSPIFSAYHTNGNYLSTNPSVNIQENTGLATLHISMSIDDGGEPNGLTRPKYSVETSPSIWQFSLLPAANIEGNYVVQDMQMKNQSKITFSVNAESQFPATNLSQLTGFLNELSNMYVNSGFLTNFNYNTGITELSCGQSWIGQNSFNSGFDNIKVVGSSSLDWTRAQGYNFGY